MSRARALGCGVIFAAAFAWLAIAQPASASQSTTYPNLNGTISYSYTPGSSGASVQVSIDKIQNPSATQTTGALRIEFWVLTAPFTGQSDPGYQLLTKAAAALPAGSAVSAFSAQAVSTLNMQPATYYPAVLVYEFFASGCSSADQYCLVNYENFSQPFTVGKANSESMQKGNTAVVREGAVFSSGQAASQSFLRFYNTSASAGSATVTLRDYNSGQSLGQWTSPGIPAGAELQYAISTVEAALPAGAAKPNYYSISVQSTFAGYFQHVLFRPSDGTLTNLSTCGANVTADPAKLAGVHSSILGTIGFPSTVVVNNTGSAAAAATLGIYDARDGSKVGAYTTASVPANGSLVVPISTIESRIGKTPNGSLYHYVVKQEGTFTGFIQNLVNNSLAGVTTDMSAACTLDGTATSTATSPMNGGTIFSTAQSSSQSFLRFYNTDTTAGAVTATLRDYSTGQSLGQWTSASIPAGAEVQYAISAVETGAGITGAKPNYYTVSLQSAFTGMFQHVLFRPADGTLTNLSTCAADVTADPVKLSGVHSSLLGAIGFASSIAITNTGSSLASPVIGLYDARDGSKIGVYTPAAIQPNGTSVIAVSTIEAGIGKAPAAGMYHYVVKLENSFTGFMQHLVNNSKAGVITDMTTACGMIEDGILAGAIAYTGSYSSPVTVTYVDKTNTTNSITAFPGQVILNTSTTASAASIAAVVQGGGGSIVGQLPRLGAYWVSVQTGKEATFINAVKNNSLVVDARPSVAMRPGQVQTPIGDLTDGSVLNYTPLFPDGDVVVLDGFGANDPVVGGSCPTVRHGDFVAAVAANTGPGEPAVSVSQYQVDNYLAGSPGLTDIYSNSYTYAFALARIAAGAAITGGVKTVNISSQGANAVDANGKYVGGDEGNVDRHNCTALDATCQRLLATEEAFLRQIYFTIENMPAAVRSHIMITVITGNSGLDLSPMLARLKRDFPDAANNIIPVSGLDANGNADQGVSSGCGSSDVVYAPDTQTAIALSQTCTDNGTSFSAPQVARIAAQMAKTFPGMTADQIVAALKGAAPRGSTAQCPSFSKIPTYQQAIGTGTTYYTLTVGVAGSGLGSVSTNPTATSYASGSTVTISAVAAPGSVFAGFSGGGCGAASTCSVAITNQNVSVTAIFNLNPDNSGSGGSGSGGGGSSGGGSSHTFTGTLTGSAAASSPSGDGCTPNPLVVTASFGASAQLQVNGLLQVPGTYAATLSMGVETTTVTSPSLTCTIAGQTSTVPGSNSTSTSAASSTQGTVVSDGSHLTFGAGTIPAPPGCSASAITGTVSVAPVTGIVTVAVNFSVSCSLGSATSSGTSTILVTASQ